MAGVGVLPKLEKKENKIRERRFRGKGEREIDSEKRTRERGEKRR